MQVVWTQPQAARTAPENGTPDGGLLENGDDGQPTVEPEWDCLWSAMTPEEFRNLGYLQEVNRLILHPLGLALSVVTDDAGNTTFGKILDARDDAGGIVFQMDTYPDTLWEKARMVSDEAQKRQAGRMAECGFWVQPVEED